MSYKLLKQGVRRISDGAQIPDDIRNTDYAEYLKWVDAGKTPEPADVDTPEQIKDKANAPIHAQMADRKSVV